MDIRRQRTSRNRILAQGQIQLIHEHTLELLEKTGVWVQSEEALEILGNAGCNVKDPKRVKIPRKVGVRNLEVAHRSRSATRLYKKNMRMEVIWRI